MASALLVVVPVLVIAMLVLGLGPLPFFSGDAGPKVLQAQAFLSADAGWPRTICLPDSRLVPPPGTESTLLVRKGDHWVSMFSFLFSALIAVALRAFGEEGALVVPALFGIVSAGLAEFLARRLGSMMIRGAVFAVVLLGTPLGFYSVTIWEHTLAVGLALAALCVLSVRHSPLGWAFCGALVSLAAWTRPEMHFLAIVLVLPLTIDKGARESAMCVLAGGFSFALTYAAMMALQAVMLGEPWPVHLGNHPDRVVFSDGFLSARLDVMRAFLFPDVPRGLATVVVAGASAWVARRRATHPRRAAWIGIVASALASLLVVGAGAAAIMRGSSPSLAFPMASAILGWSVLWALPWLLATRSADEPRDPLARRAVVLGLWVVPIATFVASPGTLGFQWAARGYLLTIVLAVVLIASTSNRAKGLLDGRSAMVAGAAAGILVQALGFAFLGHVVDGNRLLRALLLETARSAPIITDTRFVSDLLAPEWRRQPVMQVSRDATFRASLDAVKASGATKALLASVREDNASVLRGEQSEKGGFHVPEGWLVTATSSHERRNRNIDLAWIEASPTR